MLRCMTYSRNVKTVFIHDNSWPFTSNTVVIKQNKNQTSLKH